MIFCLNCFFLFLDFIFFRDLTFSLRVQTLTATLKVIVGGKEEAKEDDIIEEEAGYKASFSKLAHGRKQDVDPFPQLDKAIFFAESVHNFSKQHPGKVGFSFLLWKKMFLTSPI